MASFNQITLVGRLGKEPEFTFTPSGTAVCKCSMAVDDHISKERKETDWFNLVFFGSLAEVVEKYLYKGSCILVSGKMKLRSYKDKQGQTKTWPEVVCNSMQMLDSKEKSQTRTTTSSSSNSSDIDVFDPFLDDDEPTDFERLIAKNKGE